MPTNNTGVDFDADVAFAVNDLTESFTHSGTSYEAVIDPISVGQSLEGVEGYFADINFLIVVQTSLFASTTRPVSGDKVTVSSKAYRVVRVDTDEADAAMNIFVEEVTA